MAILSPFGPFRAFDDNGDPLNGGKLYTYEAGTSTPKATYTDAGGMIANSNPVILDSAGYANVWLGSGGYKFVLKNSLDVEQWTIDDIGGDSSNAFGSSITVNSGNLAVTTVYANGVIRQTGGGTLSLLPAASAGAGFYFIVRRETSATITIDPNSTETINGASTLLLNTDAVIICDGSNWYTLFMGVSLDGDNTLSGNNTFTGKILIPSDGTLVISSGAVTVTGSYHLIDTEASAAVDQLDTINGGSSGQVLMLRTNADARDVVVTNSGNITTPDGLSVYLNSTNTTLTLRYDGGKSKWIVQAIGDTPVIQRNYLDGFNMSTAGASATMTIGAGMCADSTNVVYIIGSSIAKTTSAWAVGTGNGGIDTGSIANSTWYHFYAIRRPDTGVVDVVFSLSASSPTLPANYTQYRRIGSGKTNGSAQWTRFFQDGDSFIWLDSVVDIAATNPGTSAVTRTLASVPTGVRVYANTVSEVYDPASLVKAVILSDLDITDETPSIYNTPSNSDTGSFGSSGSVVGSNMAIKFVRTNTSAQIRSRIAGAGVSASTVLNIRVRGWIDKRGQE